MSGEEYPLEEALNIVPTPIAICLRRAVYYALDKDRNPDNHDLYGAVELNSAVVLSRDTSRFRSNTYVCRIADCAAGCVLSLTEDGDPIEIKAISTKADPIDLQRCKDITDWTAEDNELLSAYILKKS